MITKNFKNLYQLARRAVLSSGTASEFAITGMNGNTNGGNFVYNSNPLYNSTSAVFMATAFLYRYSSYFNDFSKPKIALGVGQTPTNGEETSLADYIITDALPKANISQNADGAISISGVIQNNSENEKTFYEVGYVAALYDYIGFSSRTDVLFDRQLLETPITIPGGGSAVVTMVLNWSD